MSNFQQQFFDTILTNLLLYSTYFKYRNIENIQKFLLKVFFHSFNQTWQITLQLDCVSGKNLSNTWIQTVWIISYVGAICFLYTLLVIRNIGDETVVS